MSTNRLLQAYHSIAFSVLIKIHVELNLPLYYNNRMQALYCFQIKKDVITLALRYGSSKFLVSQILSIFQVTLIRQNVTNTNSTESESTGIGLFLTIDRSHNWCFHHVHVADSDLRWNPRSEICTQVRESIWILWRNFLKNPWILAI